MKSRIARVTILTAAIMALLYGAVAYLILPAAWSHHEHQPGLARKPMVTRTKQGIPGDALNVGLVGDKATVIDGPFTETKELVAGFWIWEVKSMAMRRSPPGGTSSNWNPSDDSTCAVMSTPPLR